MNKRYQVVELKQTDLGPRWQFIAHGAAMTRNEADGFARSIKNRGGRAIVIEIPGD